MTRLAAAVFLLSLASTAEAYVGPGMGLGVIAAVVGFLTAVLLALAGMVWYPMKRMLRSKRSAAAEGAEGLRPSPEQQSPGSDK
jgi:hypothetical protein